MMMFSCQQSMQHISKMQYLGMDWITCQNTKPTLSLMQAKKTAALMDYNFFSFFF